MTGRSNGGKIITFYSYKGGTGRSMALANVAWILASTGKRVLTLDWDLEAPGLHRYFYPFLVDKDLSSCDGLIDFVLKFTTAAMEFRVKTSDQNADTNNPVGQTDQPDNSKDNPDWYKPYANILRYASSLKWDFENGGSLDFIPAGRQGLSYSTRVNSFNWQNFYDLLGGGALLESAKEKMRSEYDYILIDSRTGVSDTSGICTVQMPDILVICFTLNNQSIEGAAGVANAVQEQRLKSEKAIQIFPVPMRVENAEKIKLQKRKEHAKEKFKLFPNSLPGEERDRYWGDVPVIYVPYYAYEEILAAFGDNSADRISVLAAAEQLTSYLTAGEVKKLTPISQARRLDVLAVYEGGPQTVSPAEELNRFAESIFDGLSTEDKERVRRVFTRLVRVAQPNEVGGDTLLRLRSRDIEPSVFSILRPLIDARLLELEQDDGNYTVKIASDSLLPDWKRLRGWINDDREFLLWRQKLQIRLEEWEKGNRDEGALLTGMLLNEAERWRAVKGTELSDTEASYINTSLEVRDRTSRIEQEKSLYGKWYSGFVSLRRWFASLRLWSASHRQGIRRAAVVLVNLLIVLGSYAAYEIWTQKKQAALDQARYELGHRANLHNSLGLENLNKGNLYSAVDSFGTAIGIDPSFTEAYMNRGNAYRRLDLLDKAIVDFTQTIKLAPNYPNPYYYRGLAYRSKGDKDRAIADFQQCANLSSDRYWIVNSMTRLQQVRDGFDISIFSPSVSEAEEVRKEVERAAYRVATRSGGVLPYLLIRYGSDSDQGNAEDLRDLISDYYLRQNKRIEARVEQTNVTNNVKIGVFLPYVPEAPK